jgi:hypothetical protein
LGGLPTFRINDFSGSLVTVSREDAPFLPIYELLWMGCGI